MERFCPTSRGALGRSLRLIALATAAVIWLGTSPASGQSSAASLAGTVVDQSGGVLPGVDVVATNVATAVARSTVTGSAGQFVFPSLVPGTYTVTATLAGFRPAEVPNIALNIGGQETIRIQLEVGGVGDEVTVIANAHHVSTSPAVSTVVDRTFVEALPLSGRSLQSLLQLTPGVTLFSANSNPLAGGQFSVNGQRTNANYFTVDGVSANANMTTGTGSFAGHSIAGSLPALSALGSTQSLVSVDALEEFRVQTSTYSPEFGRMPGAQIQMVTRSGTNKFSGSASWYFRDDSMDASDYFAKLNNLPKAKLSQNNFSAVLGGPIVRGKTFFFASYEGLRLRLPQTYLGGVPTAELRASAPPALRALLNAFPLPNGPVLSPGIAQFGHTYEDPSTLNASSLRIDHTMGAFTLFGRYSHSPSQSTARSSSRNTITENTYWNDSATGGLTWVKGNVVNELRANWTDTRAKQYRRFDDSFAGTSLPAEEVMFPSELTEHNAFFLVGLNGTDGFGFGTGNDNFQRQVNVVNTLTWVRDKHTVKGGIDFRRMQPILNRAGGDFSYIGIGPVGNVPLGQIQFAQLAMGGGETIPIYDNLSIFIQDTWSVRPKLTLTYGVRWELNPAPGSANDTLPWVMEDIEAPIVVFAPKGETKLHNTRYTNFAPRLGVAYQMSDRPGRETVLRGGIGTFYDTGAGLSGIAFDHIFPNFFSKVVPPDFSNTAWPLTEEQRARPDPATILPQQFWQMDRNIKTPYSIQWNVSVEQALGQTQSVTVTYVGSTGKDLLRRESRTVRLEEYLALYPTHQIFTSYTTNGGRANYHGLQFQYQRRLSNGFQALANYTLSSAKDTVSSDDSFRDGGARSDAVDLDDFYGPADFDVRHSYSLGATYTLPSPDTGLMRAVLGGWGLDGMLRGRSAFPIQPYVATPFPNLPNQSVLPDLTGEPIRLTGSACPGKCPGGWALNPAAFKAPAPGTIGNMKRNSIRGFGAWQIDMALRRDFALPGGTRLQFKAEAFNVTNHVNLADPNVQPFGAPFGIPTQMLNRGLGSLNPLYQMGGPRSGQVSLKFLF